MINILLKNNLYFIGEDILAGLLEACKFHEIDLSKCVCVTSDGAPSMTGKNIGFISLLRKHLKRPLIQFHCLIHQEALVAKSSLKDLLSVMELVTTIVNFIASRDLNKREFKILLNEVQSQYDGLLMYNHVRWLSRGKVLVRFVECLDEIRYVHKT